MAMTETLTETLTETPARVRSNLVHAAWLKGTTNLTLARDIAPLCKHTSGAWL